MLWGRAWKEANELEKHAGRIELPAQFYSIIMNKNGRFKPLVLPAYSDSELEFCEATLKPLFEVNDRVFASCNPGVENSWYPGVVTGYKQVAHNEYGPVRKYSIKFADGDKNDGVPEEYVFLEVDYLVKDLFDDKHLGVKNRRGKNTEDKWASIIGWYEIVIGKFNLLLLNKKCHLMLMIFVLCRQAKVDVLEPIQGNASV